MALRSPALSHKVEKAGGWNGKTKRPCLHSFSGFSAGDFFQNRENV
jgi:hypothetical protein